MTDVQASGMSVDRAALERLVAEADTGGRTPGKHARRALFLIAIAWSLFQLWYASPLPFALNFLILNDTQARAIHLGMALFLAFAAFPAFKRSPRNRIPLLDWGLACAGAISAGYLFVFYRELSARPGLPTSLDLVISAIGLVVLLEAARRAVGPAMAVIAVLFLVYIFAGPHLPGMISHKGASISRAMSQMWLTTEGVFGVALGVSTSFVFLFVLFGALLERAGAGNYFIQLAFSFLGHMRGGPAKAGVVSSGLTGMISGSSIANVVTTGTFTIPLMKRVGYTAVKAGAIESAAGVNGQIMPPVMGAAAFLIAEYVGISYAQVVKHAFLPAIITYLALFYIVDIEAVKLGMKGIVSERRQSRMRTLFSFTTNLCGFIILSGIVYYGIGWTKNVFGPAATWIVGAGIAAAYVGLVAYRAQFPDLKMDNPQEALQLPGFIEVARTGAHFLIPVVVLIWCLMVEALSPGLSAFWATVALMAILITQWPLTAIFRKESDLISPLRHGFHDLFEGLSAGGRNMIGVGIATAAAGIIVGTVSLTGIGLVMTELVDYLSGGNLMIMLGLTAVICLILGMGMPTTASYVIVATLMAPVVVDLAAQNDLAIPLVAVHLFVFYFGLMADVTPPVGLAAYAAAAIAGADPIRTGIQAFRYEIRTGLLPFIFIFENQILMIGIHGIGEFVLVVTSAILAMFMFVAATQGYFLVRNKWYEAAALLLVCFTLFRPSFWLDMIYPPFVSVPATQIESLAASAANDATLRIRAEGETTGGKTVEKTIRLPLGAPGPASERFKRIGLTIKTEGDKVVVDDIAFRSTANRLGLDLDWEIKAIEIPAERPARELMFVPAILLLGLVVLLQRTRRRIAASPPAVA